MVLAALRDRLASVLNRTDKATPSASAHEPARRPHPAPQETGLVVPFRHSGGWATSSVGADPRRMSPRQMLDLSRRLRESGRLDGRASALLAFQAELHPDYAATIGALGGPPEAPDRPRNQLAAWQQRLTFALTHTPGDHERIGQLSRIVEVLEALAGRWTAAAEAPAPALLRPQRTP